MYLTRAGTDSEVVIRKLAPCDGPSACWQILCWVRRTWVFYAGRTTVTSGGGGGWGPPPASDRSGWADPLMCGIIACRTQAPAIDYLLTALRRLEYRGYDSAGVAVRTTTGDVVRFRTVGHVEALNRSVAGWTGPELDGTGIGHPGGPPTDQPPRAMPTRTPTAAGRSVWCTTG